MKIAIVGCRDLGGYPYSDFCTHMELLTKP